MATDGPTPKPCNKKIFEEGECLAALEGSSNKVERWVKRVAARANAKVDWHYAGGIARVLHLGDDASRKRTIEAIHALAPKETDAMKAYEKGQIFIHQVAAI